MTVDEVRNVLGAPSKSFKKTPMDTIPSDAYRELGIHIHYKQPDVCEAVEMALAADPTFQGRRFIERPFDEILGWLKTLDDSIVVDDTGLIAYELGIALYVPGLPENISAPVEGVLVFEKGYYD